MTAKEIQDNFNRNVCRGFLRYCKDNKISPTKLLAPVIKGKPNYQTIQKVASGERGFIYPIALFYLSEAIGINDPIKLYLYSINNP